MITGSIQNACIYIYLPISFYHCIALIFILHGQSTGTFFKSSSDGKSIESLQLFIGIDTQRKTQSANFTK